METKRDGSMENECMKKLCCSCTKMLRLIVLQIVESRNKLLNYVHIHAAEKTARNNR